MLIDANIFLEFLLDQQEAQRCLDFLEKVREGAVRAVVSTFTIDSILIELERHQHDAEIMKRFLQSLLGHKGLRIYVPTMDDRLKAIAHLALGLDFEDALTLQSAIANNEKEIMSFDKDFDKIKSIKRTQPPLPN
ncbi:type II toxin-antitoxin system VapC family toxin [Candidatus Woesearchaeota archaeon]|nr:type II toxin-antitoxin system VapC family toxin [Candidatus Woesearchaeota archaeon]